MPRYAVFVIGRWYFVWGSTTPEVGFFFRARARPVVPGPDVSDLTCDLDPHADNVVSSPEPPPIFFKITTWAPPVGDMVGESDATPVMPLGKEWRAPVLGVQELAPGAS